MLFLKTNASRGWKIFNNGYKTGVFIPKTSHLNLESEPRAYPGDLVVCPILEILDTRAHADAVEL